MRISVIIPCYNVEKYIERCLNCLEKQTIGIDSLEIILIDDASSDNTLQILQLFEEKYVENVILIPCKENVGAAAARNIGISYASGEYISFIDADDVVDSAMIEKMVGAIEQYKCDVVECEYKSFSDINECVVSISGEERYYDLTNNNIRKAFIIEHGMKSAVWGRLYRKEFIDRTEIEFIEGAVYEDVHFSGISLFLMESIFWIPETMYFYYDNKNGIINTSNNEKLKQEVDIIRLTLEELDDRKLLDKVLLEFSNELECYCILKSYIDPIRMLITNNGLCDEDILFYRDSLLEIFPNAYDNKYAKMMAKNSSLWDSMIRALKGTNSGISTHKTKMITVKIIGGLGNQMRCYWVGYMLSKLLNTPLMIDVTDYYLGYFRQYILDYLDIPSTTKIWHSVDVPAYSDVANLPFDIKDNYDLFLNIDEIGSKEELLRKIADYQMIYIYGYDENHIFEEEKECYSNIFKPIYDSAFLNYFKELISDQNSVSVHIRRTDFLDLNWCSDDTLDFYIAAMNYIREKVDNAHFYIFSDDVEWAKKNLIQHQDCSFVDSFGGEVQSMYDMFCMSSCKHHIVTRKSTYSKWASMLSQDEEGVSICESSGDEKEDLRDYGRLNIVFLDRRLIEHYKMLGGSDSDCIEGVFSAADECEKIERLLESNCALDALETINAISVGRGNGMSEDIKQRLVDYRAISYFQLEKYEMSLDSFKAIKGKRFDYDFLYNYALCLEMTGHHTEGLCYSTVAKALNRESDIDSFVCSQNEYEDCLVKIIYKAYTLWNINSNRKLIFLSSFCPNSIIKYMISMANLLHDLGFKVFIWKNGINSLEELENEIIPNSIVISNLYEYSLKSDLITSVFYEATAIADVDYYYFRNYTSKEIEEIHNKADVYVSISGSERKKVFFKEYDNNRNKIFYSDSLLLTWETGINDEDYIWQCAEVLNAILDEN